MKALKKKKKLPSLKSLKDNHRLGNQWWKLRKINGRPRVLEDRYCVVCNKLFRPRYSKQKCCVYKCSTQARPKKGRMNTCKLCRLEFYVSKVFFNKKFCSKICFNQWLKDNSFHFPCIICKKEIYTQPAQLRLRSRKTCSKKCNALHRRMLAEKRRVGQGYTKHQLDRLARYSPEAEKWRKQVFERDDYTCRICEIRGARLEADHIKPWAYFPELRFELSNGRTLCRPCHDKTKIPANQMRIIYGKT